MLAVILILTIFLITYLVPKIYSATQQALRIDKVKKMHKIFWNGTPEEELYAWYKVRNVLKQRGGSDGKIEVVNRVISELDQESMMGEFEVDSQGALIDNSKSVRINL